VRAEPPMARRNESPDGVRPPGPAARGRPGRRRRFDCGSEDGCRRRWNRRREAAHPAAVHPDGVGELLRVGLRRAADRFRRGPRRAVPAGGVGRVPHRDRRAARLGRGPGPAAG
jgi:hypothetical protein